MEDLADKQSYHYILSQPSDSKTVVPTFTDIRIDGDQLTIDAYATNLARGTSALYDTCTLKHTTANGR